MNGTVTLKPVVARPVAPPAAKPDADVFGHDRLVQRHAMLAMAAAMGTMAVGLPLHLSALRGTVSHAAAGPGAWPAAVLATIALAAALPALRGNEGVPATLGRGEQTLLLCCAAAAYAAGWIGILGGTHGLVYFDVAAMSVAWIAEGRALDMDGRRRALAAAEQLWLLTGARCPPAPPLAQRGIALPLAAAIGAGAIGAAVHALQTGTVGQALVAGLATLAACCPCALGSARASALAAGRELAGRDGWIVASTGALELEEPWRAAIGLPLAACDRLTAVGRAARRAARLGTLWAVFVPALMLPLALRGPVDPLLPAAAMVVAWAAIRLTNRLFVGDCAGNDATLFGGRDT